MCRIPEPHEIADAYYARLDEAREALIRDAHCEDCNHYKGAPEKWSKVPFGWCPKCEEFVEADDSVREYDCESFDPVDGYEPGDPTEGYYDDWDD